MPETEPLSEKEDLGRSVIKKQQLNAEIVKLSSSKFDPLIHSLILVVVLPICLTFANEYGLLEGFEFYDLIIMILVAEVILLLDRFGRLERKVDKIRERLEL